MKYFLLRQHLVILGLVAAYFEVNALSGEVGDDQGCADQNSLEFGIMEEDLIGAEGESEEIGVALGCLLGYSAALRSVVRTSFEFLKSSHASWLTQVFRMLLLQALTINSNYPMEPKYNHNNDRHSPTSSKHTLPTNSKHTLPTNSKHTLPTNTAHLKTTNSTSHSHHPALRTLQRQFLDHCALIIQSRWKGSAQRKRYRQFLPIYRRFKQLVEAIAEGWKTRQILKLATIKSQIGLVKDRQGRNQASSARIAKRELIDEVERFKKKGKWIEQYRKQRALTKKLQLEKGKENSSLFANIKPTSIKNVFKQQQTRSEAQNNRQAWVQSEASLGKVQLGGKSGRYNSNQVGLERHSAHDSREQVPIPAKQNVYVLLELKPQRPNQTNPRQQAPISKYLKQPSNYLKQPSNYLKQPSNYLKQPSNYLEQPSNYLEQPSNYLKQAISGESFQEVKDEKIVGQAQRSGSSVNGEIDKKDLSAFSRSDQKHYVETPGSCQETKQKKQSLCQNLSLQYRQNYLNRTMSIKRKPDKADKSGHQAKLHSNLLTV